MRIGIALVVVLFSVEASAQCPGGRCPPGAASIIIASGAPSSSYTPRWHNHDGLTPHQHLERVHGESAAGLSTSQVRMRMDAYHDRFGPAHRGAIARSVVRPNYSIATVRRPWR